MSRRTRERGLEAQERWPNLCRFLASIDSGATERGLDETVEAADLEFRKAVLKEWWDWNSKRAWQPDGRDLISDGFGLDFPGDAEARQFMNMVYDKLIVSVRAETNKDWKP